MNTENMKNMVMLKDLPSNIIDEAIIILKPNIKIRSLDTSKKNNSNNKKIKEEDSKKYIINEAEMLITNYITKIENNKNSKPNKKIENRYKRLKLISILLGIGFIVSIFC